MNLKIRQLEDNIVYLLNSSEVDMEVKRLILTDVLSMVEKQANKLILQESQLSEPITEMGEMKDAEST